MKLRKFLTLYATRIQISFPIFEWFWKNKFLSASFFFIVIAMLFFRLTNLNENHYPETARFYPIYMFLNANFFCVKTLSKKLINYVIIGLTE